MVGPKFLKKIKTEILCSKISSENPAAYEITCKTMVSPNRPRMTV